MRSRRGAGIFQVPSWWGSSLNVTAGRRFRIVRQQSEWVFLFAFQQTSFTLTQNPFKYLSENYKTLFLSCSDGDITLPKWWRFSKFWMVIKVCPWLHHLLARSGKNYVCSWRSSMDRAQPCLSPGGDLLPPGTGRDWHEWSQCDFCPGAPRGC